MTSAPSHSVRFFHGTSLENAELLIDIDLTPRLAFERFSPRIQRRLDWTDYTDFGQGFYTHTEENRDLAFDWARGKFPEWGVVEFVLSRSRLTLLLPTALYFHRKRSRPPNSPRLPAARWRYSPWEMAPSVDATGSPLPASWLEFVEHNRHVEPNQSVFRPNDRDWTGRYAFMRGPLWVPRDSGLQHGLPPFADHIHQVNCGRAGMRELNAPRNKELRRLHTADSQRRRASSAP